MGDPRFLDTEGWRGTVSECPADDRPRAPYDEHADEHHDDAPRDTAMGTGERT